MSVKAEGMGIVSDMSETIRLVESVDSKVVGYVTCGVDTPHPGDVLRVGKKGTKTDRGVLALSRRLSHVLGMLNKVDIDRLSKLAENASTLPEGQTLVHLCEAFVEVAGVKQRIDCLVYGLPADVEDATTPNQ